MADFWPFGPPGHAQWATRVMPNFRPSDQLFYSQLSAHTPPWSKGSSTYRTLGLLPAEFISLSFSPKPRAGAGKLGRHDRSFGPCFVVLVARSCESGMFRTVHSQNQECVATRRAAFRCGADTCGAERLRRLG